MQKLILKLASILGQLAIGVIIAVVAFHVGRDYQKQHPARDALDTLPSIQEVQRRIGAKIDGKLGPETQKLWDKLVCQQSCDWTVANMLKENQCER